MTSDSYLSLDYHTGCLAQSGNIMKVAHHLVTKVRVVSTGGLRITLFFFAQICQDAVNNSATAYV